MRFLSHTFIPLSMHAIMVYPVTCTQAWFPLWPLAGLHACALEGLQHVEEATEPALPHLFRTLVLATDRAGSFWAACG